MAKKKNTEKKQLTAKQKLELAAEGYFERYPNVKEFYATDGAQFFFKENDAKRNAAGGKVHNFKRGK